MLKKMFGKSDCKAIELDTFLSDMKMPYISSTAMYIDDQNNPQMLDQILICFEGSADIQSKILADVKNAFKSLGAEYNKKYLTSNLLTGIGEDELNFKLNLTFKIPKRFNLTITYKIYTGKMKLDSKQGDSIKLVYKRLEDLFL